MATVTAKHEIRALEQQFWQALKDGDVDAAVELTDFPCIVTGPQGIGQIDRERFAAMMRSPSYTMHRFELGDDLTVRLVNDDVAVVAYKVHEELSVEGRPVTLDAADSSTWVRRDGRWRCVQHSEAIVGDPFGRDRQPAA
jgi:uncharacterized protein (TIGR02246 family)